MTWKKWHFQSGERYALSEVIDACDVRIREGDVVRRDSKNQMVRQMEKHAPATIVWCPKADRGWVPRHLTKTVGAQSRATLSFLRRSGSRSARHGSSIFRDRLNQIDHSRIVASCLKCECHLESRNSLIEGLRGVLCAGAVTEIPVRITVSRFVQRAADAPMSLRRLS